MADSRAGAGKVREELEYLLVTKSKEVPQTDGDM